MTPSPGVAGTAAFARLAPAPRWSTIRRAVELAVAKRSSLGMYTFESFSESAQQLLTRAQAEAQAAGLNYIGTEHLLLAAFDDPSSHAAHILASLELNKPDARAAIDHVLRTRVPRGLHRIVPTARVKRVIEIAFDLCGSAGDPRVSTGHILLALSTEGKGLAAQVMQEAGATPDRIKTAMEKLSDPEP